jgi:hypothetical protein
MLMMCVKERNIDFNIIGEGNEIQTSFKEGECDFV